MAADLRSLRIKLDVTVREAMRAIDLGTERICLVTDDDRRLLGVVTDGDLRRGLLEGAGLDDQVAPLVSRNPVTARPDESRAAVLELMRARRLGQVPIVDVGGYLVGMHTLSDLVGAPERDNIAIIFAGGRGTRLGRFTEAVPKPMMPVAGRPILERLILHLSGAGISRFYVAVNYLADVIEAHFADGSELGCDIKYLREAPDRPLGPGGALSLLREGNHLDNDLPILALNGDLVIDADMGAMLDHHAASGSVATIAARDYVHEVPFGVVEAGEAGALTSLVEKPTSTWQINAGIYVLEPHLLDLVPTDTEYTIPLLLEGCVQRGEKVSVWEIEGDWIDVGRPADLRTARGDAST
jgi:dTDP-glucose pyrophosphorylase